MTSEPMKMPMNPIVNKPPITPIKMTQTGPRRGFDKPPVNFQARDAPKPSQASPAVTMQAIQLAHKGIEVVAPTVTGKPLRVRPNCSIATHSARWA